MLRLAVRGLGGRQVKVQLSHSDSIGKLKAKLQQLGGHPASWQQLSYGGQTMDSDDRTVSSYLSGAGTANLVIDMSLRPPSEGPMSVNKESAANTLGRESGGRLREIFDRFDADSNGLIDAVELQARSAAPASCLYVHACKTQQLCILC
eukprot:SAG31_NODE_70_length_28117_cov_100.521843_33_plen_149_part_00